MKFIMDFENYTEELDSDYESLFNQVAQETVLFLKIRKNYEYSVSIVDEESIRKYNHQYRQIDAGTDVLSFAFTDYEDVIIMKNKITMLGDILICYQRAKQQAQEYGHSLRREMAFLFIHGLLHLLGYDHGNEKDEAEMFAIQNNVLERLGIRKEE